MKKNTILITEDDLLSAEYLKEILTKEGYEILGIIDSAEEAIEKCKVTEPDILLMDIMLKGKLSGCEATVEIKQHHPECIIIFLTAYANTEMIDYAVRSKAYAYLMKPYREKEILATIKVALSHDHIDTPKEEEEIIELKNGFSFDTKHRCLSKAGKEIPLTSKKLKLIELLAKNKNSTVSNEQICMQVWGEMKSNSTLRSLIFRFRSSICDDIITSINSVGYSVSS